LSGHVPDAEEAACVDGAALVHVISIHVRQARCGEIDSGAAHHSVLDRNVVEVVVFNIRRRFDLNETPALVSTALEHINSD
jgi:hypothetical protein